MAVPRLEVIALPAIPEIRPGDDLAAVIASALSRAGLVLASGDVLVVAQKIVSKSEDRFVELASVTPSEDAIRFARETDKDPRLVHLILGESERVLRHRRNVLIVEHKRGWVLANAGIDASNVGCPGAVLLLPKDPDSSAARLRERLGVPVIVSDSWGRAWRVGTTGVALGAAGLPAVLDLRGRADRDGRTLRATEIALADEIAAAASLVQGAADEGTPVALVRGVAAFLAAAPATDATALVRAKDEDLFL
jgi:coenzyme F420-0:L-glutamate ligase / coenzyme F420-1:gamma-L-glutamate ligase